LHQASPDLASGGDLPSGSERIIAGTTENVNRAAALQRILATRCPVAEAANPMQLYCVRCDE
jgi:hypothetical protein